MADPQHGWMVQNMAITTFLDVVPIDQKLRVRGEELINDTDHCLSRIAKWLQLRTDEEALDSMKHPERWPYAFYGPPGARLGSGRPFLDSPSLRPASLRDYGLDGPLEWRSDGEGFSAEVKELARDFGYN